MRLGANGVPTTFGFDSLEILPDGSFLATRGGASSELYEIDPSASPTSGLAEVRLIPLVKDPAILGSLNGLTAYNLFQTITIDIRPDSASNPINPRQRGFITVAILTTSVADGDAVDFDPFDAADPVDPSTLAFGPGEAGIVHATGHAEDVDGDGDLDMVLHFDTQETGIACGASEATLSGATFGGQAIAGTDSLVTVGCL